MADKTPEETGSVAHVDPVDPRADPRTHSPAGTAPRRPGDDDQHIARENPGTKVWLYLGAAIVVLAILFWIFADAFYGNDSVATPTEEADPPAVATD